METNILNKHHRIGLKIIGAWPGHTRLWAFLSYIAWSSSVCFFAFWDLVKVYSDLEAFCDNLVSTMGTVGILFKLTSLRLKRSSLVPLINDMLKDWSKEPVPEVIGENNSIARNISKCILILYNFTYFTYVSKTLLSYFFDRVEDRKFLAAISLPFDGKQSPKYEIIFVTQAILAFTCLNFSCVIEGLLTFLVLHACSKAAVVRQEIAKLAVVCRAPRCHEKSTRTAPALERFLRVHINFIEFSKNLQRTFADVSFFHIFFFTMIQIFSGFMLMDSVERGILVNGLHYATLTNALIISIGYYCVLGEYLSSQSELIFHEFYNCCWYEFPFAEKKLVSFMLMKARKSSHLTVGKFDQLSLVYLTRVIKTSFSCLSLVRAVR